MFKKKDTGIKMLIPRELPNILNNGNHHNITSFYEQQEIAVTVTDDWACMVRRYRVQKWLCVGLNVRQFAKLIRRKAISDKSPFIPFMLSHPWSNSNFLVGEEGTMPKYMVITVFQNIKSFSRN